MCQGLEVRGKSPAQHGTWEGLRPSRGLKQSEDFEAGGGTGWPRARGHPEVLLQTWGWPRELGVLNSPCSEAT